VGVMQRIRHRDPILLLICGRRCRWPIADRQARSSPDVCLENADDPATHQLIYDYVMHRKYDQFGVRSNNCTDLVIETAATRGINLMHRIRLTWPPEAKFLGRTRRVWTDPQYRILEFSSPDVLEADLRPDCPVRIGSDVTECYPVLKR